MQASKLTIDPDKLRFNKMSYKKRAQLRRQNIIDLINSKPAGEIISLNEFAAVTQTSDASVYSVLQTMLREGIVTRTIAEGTKNRFSWSIGAQAQSKTPSHVQLEKVSTAATPVAEFPTQTLGDYAREYAWEKNDDSLRGFVKWMDGKELDLRRMLSGGGY